VSEPQNVNQRADAVETAGSSHCKLWREPKQRAPPDTPVADSQPRELTYDTGFFEREVA